MQEGTGDCGAAPVAHTHLWYPNTVAAPEHCCGTRALLWHASSARSRRATNARIALLDRRDDLESLLGLLQQSLLRCVPHRVGHHSHGERWLRTRGAPSLRSQAAASSHPGDRAVAGALVSEVATGTIVGIDTRNVVPTAQPASRYDVRERIVRMSTDQTAPSMQIEFCTS